MRNLHCPPQLVWSLDEFDNMMSAVVKSQRLETVQEDCSETEAMTCSLEGSFDCEDDLYENALSLVQLSISKDADEEEILFDTGDGEEVEWSDDETLSRSGTFSDQEDNDEDGWSETTEPECLYQTDDFFLDSMLRAALEMDNHEPNGTPNTFDASSSAPTSNELCRLLRGRDWQAVEDLLLSYPEEAEQRVLLALPHHHTSIGLPLHVACCMRPVPPPGIITVLLSVFPEAAVEPETTWGMLPLHFAANLTECCHQSISSPATVATDQRDMVHLLLAVAPETWEVREGFNGMLPLHVAASSCPMLGRKVPSSAAQVVQFLVEHAPTVDALFITEYGGDTSMDLGKRRSELSPTNCVAPLDWCTNPLLAMDAAPPSHMSSYFDELVWNHALNKPVTKSESPALALTQGTGDYNDDTEFNRSIGRLASNSSLLTESTATMSEEESGSDHAATQTIEHLDGSFDSLMGEDQCTADSSDDSSFVTAYSHEESAGASIDLDAGVLSKRCLVNDLICPDLDVSAGLALALTARASANIIAFDENKEKDYDESVLTVTPALEFTTMESSSFASASSRTLFVPKIYLVNKVSIQFQLELLDLQRQPKCAKGMMGTLFPKFVHRKINPCCSVFIHTPTPSKTMVTEAVECPVPSSQLIYHSPVCAAMLAPAMVTVELPTGTFLENCQLEVRVYHCGSKRNRREFVGSYQASCRQWKLTMGIGKGRPLSDGGSSVAGKVRLVNFEFQPLDKSKCWRLSI